MKEQLLAREVRDAREKQLREIRSWEHEINSGDKNATRIAVENDVDLEGPPRRMTYINQYMVWFTKLTCYIVFRKTCAVF